MACVIRKERWKYCVIVGDNLVSKIEYRDIRREILSVEGR